MDITPDWQGRIKTLETSLISTHGKVKYEYIGSRVAERKLDSIFDTSTTMTYDNLGRIVSSSVTENYAPSSTIAEFEYEYAPNTNNIANIG